MGTRTYRGSCHCGDVKFEVDVDLQENGSGRCNCSYCTKFSLWSTLVKPEVFRLLTSEDKLADYSRAEYAHHRFCRRCGARVFGHGDIPQIGGRYVAVNLACLDDANLAGIPVRYTDGRANTWQVLAIEPHDSPFVRQRPC